MKTTYQLADIFTKPLDEKSFIHILSSLGMLEATALPNELQNPEFRGASSGFLV